MKVVLIKSPKVLAPILRAVFKVKKYIMMNKSLFGAGVYTCSEILYKFLLKFTYYYIIINWTMYKEKCNGL